MARSESMEDDASRERTLLTGTDRLYPPEMAAVI